MGLRPLLCGLFVLAFCLFAFAKVTFWRRMFSLRWHWVWLHLIPDYLTITLGSLVNEFDLHPIQQLEIPVEVAVVLVGFRGEGAYGTLVCIRDLSILRFRAHRDASKGLHVDDVENIADWFGHLSHRASFAIAPQHNHSMARFCLPYVRWPVCSLRTVCGKSPAAYLLPH
jgi:hypothetical protein